METYTYSPTQLYEGYKVPITWGAKQESDYFNQQISQYKRALGIVDGCEHISSITLGTFMAACMFGAGLIALLKSRKQQVRL